MYWNSHTLQADDKTCEKNLGIVHNNIGGFQPFSGNHGGNNFYALSYNYEGLTPNPGTSYNDNINSLGERSQFFGQIVLPRNDASDWIERSCNNVAFNLENIKNRRDALRQSSVNNKVLDEIGIKIKKETESNSNSRSGSITPPPPPPPPPNIGNFPEYLNGNNESGTLQKDVGNNFSSCRRDRSLSPPPPPPPSPPHIADFCKYLKGHNKSDSFQKDMEKNRACPSPPSPPRIGNISQYLNEHNKCDAFEKERRKTYDRHHRNRSVTPPRMSNRFHYHNKRNERDSSPRKIGYSSDSRRRRRSVTPPRMRNRSHYPHKRNERDSSPRKIEYNSDSRRRRRKRASSPSPSPPRSRNISQHHNERTKCDAIKKDVKQNVNRRRCKRSVTPSPSPPRSRTSSRYPNKSSDTRNRNRARSRSPLNYRDRKKSPEQRKCPSVEKKDDQKTQIRNASNDRRKELCNSSHNILQYPPSTVSAPSNSDSKFTAFSSTSTQSILTAVGSTSRDQPKGNSDQGLSTVDTLHITPNTDVTTTTPAPILTTVGSTPRDRPTGNSDQGLSTVAILYTTPNTAVTTTASAPILTTVGSTPRDRPTENSDQGLSSLGILYTTSNIAVKTTTTTSAQYGRHKNGRNIFYRQREVHNNLILLSNEETNSIQGNPVAATQAILNLPDSEQKTSMEPPQNGSLLTEEKQCTTEQRPQPPTKLVLVLKKTAAQISQSILTRAIQKLSNPLQKHKNLLDIEQKRHCQNQNDTNSSKEENEISIERINNIKPTSVMNLEGRNPQDLDSVITQSTQNLSYPKQKKVSFDKIRTLVDVKVVDITNAENRTSIEQLTKPIPNSMIYKIRSITFPKRQIIMPTEKNWRDFFESNSWVENRILPLCECYPDVNKVFSAIRKPKTMAIHLEKYLGIITNLLTSARTAGKYRDPYKFLQSIIIVNDILKSGGQIPKAHKQVCRTFLNQMDILDMIRNYKLLISLWKRSYGVINDDEVQAWQPLDKSMDEKFLNWLVHLAFNELKRISNPVLNPPKRLDELKKLHEFFIWENPYANTRHLRVSLLREIIDQNTMYLEKEGEITIGSSKMLVFARINLMDTFFDDNLDAEQKQEKDDFLIKLKVHPYAKQNYNLLIHEFLTSFTRKCYLEEADSRLMLWSENKELENLRTVFKARVPLKFLLDERLAEYGSYMSEEKIAIEEKRSPSFELNTIRRSYAPIPVPQTIEDQYKDFYEFCSGYDLKQIHNIFFNESPEGATDDLIRNVNHIQKFLTSSTISVEFCKTFIIAKIRLADKTVDEIISEKLKKEKYDLLDRLKTYHKTQKACDHIIEYGLPIRMRYLQLRNMDSKLLTESEEMDILKFENLAKSHVMKFIWKYLLDERLAEYGTFFKAVDIVQENLEEVTDIENYIEIQNNTEQ